MTGLLCSSYIEPKGDGGWGNAAYLERAQEHATAAVSHGPELPASHIALALAAFWSRRPYLVLPNIDAAANMSPESLDTRCAHMLACRGQQERALDLMDRILAFDPFHNPHLYGYRGHCLMLLGRHEEALESLELADAVTPGWRPIHIWMAACYVWRGDIARASASARRGIAFNPTTFSARAWVNRPQYPDAGFVTDYLRRLIAAGIPE